MTATDVASAVKLIGSLLIEESTLLYGVEEEVHGLQEELEIMQQYLQDADARQQDREVCALVRQVRKLVYDAEDVIDTYILKVRLGNRKWLMRFAYIMYKFPQIYQTREQIHILQTGLKRLNDKLNSHGVRRFSNLVRGHHPREDGYRRHKPQSYPYDGGNGEFVVGMEEDIRKLVDIVMGEGRTHVGVIPIVGMGGSGKTTLARKLYNHQYAKECFDCRAWVFVSQEWSTQHILSEILRKVAGPQQTKVQNTLSVEELVDTLRCILENKSYLVVLDDVWSGDALEEILPALPLGGNLNKGSKIVITTRNREIINFRVNHQEYLYIHEPQPLTQDSSWELFSKIALGHRKNYDEESFKSVGKAMLRKCDGLPLAVVALAGILNTKETIGEWQQVAEAVKSRVMEGRCENMYGRVGELLALSYDDLPYDLKPCFLYLGVFPEDYQISVGMLTRMWIAEGLVFSQYRDMSLEDVALLRVEELSHRFMIQVVRNNFKGSIKAIRIHDLLRDLCVQKAKEQSFLQIYTPFSNSDTSHVSTFPIQPRRAAVHSSIALPVHISHLRSLMLMIQSKVSHSPCSCCEETLVLKYLSQDFKLLRVLTIWGIKTVDGTLPLEIGCLIHLRYLAVRATNITVLPSSLRGLRNLLTLDYRNIDLRNSIQKENVKISIPDVFDGLGLLRHLFLPSECPWSVQELKLSTMRNLRTLWGVRLHSNNSCLLTEVPKLSTTLKKLKIVVSSKSELNSAFGCPSLMADVLHTFECHLINGLVLCNVEPLRPRKHLLKLTFIGEIQMNLSLILPVNLAKLGLRDSKIEDSDPMEALGALAHLKRLRLCNAYMGITMSCRSGSFPQLDELNVESLPLLGEWTINKGAMPCLKKLKITRCWRLRDFPLGLNFVTTLEKLEFFDMPSSFCSQAAAYGWAPQKHRLPHNFGSIIEHSDSSVDSSSIRNLFEQLIVGIFLDHRTKKYWLTKKDGNYINSFMLYASCLRISSCNFWDIAAQTAQKYEHIEYCPRFVELVIESLGDGTRIRMARLASSESPEYVVVYGKCNLGVLSLNVPYEITWVIMFESKLIPVREVRPDKKKHKLVVDELDFETKICTKLLGVIVHEEVIDIDERRNEWIHIPGGVIMTDLTSEGVTEPSLYYLKGINRLDLLIKGFIIQPKS